MSSQWTYCAPPWSGYSVAESSHPCSSPTLVLRHGLHSFTIRVGNQEEVVSTSLLKHTWMTRSSRASHAAGADCAAAVRRPSQPPTAMAVHLPPSGSCFQTRWCPSLPSNPSRGQAYTWELFFIPPCGFLHTPGWWPARLDLSSMCWKCFFYPSYFHCLLDIHRNIHTNIHTCFNSTIFTSFII